ncbi:MAG: AMP-binding protein, partial [Acidaminococcaceae bacterium]|nr:AMP-binding protein [Acidaminococcaceae bacterium]
MRKELKRLIKQNCEDLESSPQTFADIYRIIFRPRDYLLCESFDGFRTHQMTYGQMADRIESMASGLYVAIGATHGYVGLEIENCPDWIAAFWAILKSGNKPYLINCRHPQSLTEGIIKTLNITTVVGKDSTRLPVRFLSVDALQGTQPVPDVFEDEIALSTSA